MFDLILYQPEIPPNTGNIIRLCANTGTRLHLVHPLGFAMSDRELRRAGLDYREWADVREHEDWAHCCTAFGERRMFAGSTRGTVRYDQVAYAPGDVFVLGPESRGLPDQVLARFTPECVVRIPMRSGNRSLNLSNAAAVIVFEAWRQLGFRGGA